MMMMMMNYNDTISRLIESLKTNNVIWDGGKSSDKLQSINYGEATNLVYDLPAPYALITVPDSPFVTKDDFGSSMPDADIQNTLLIAIKIIVDKQDSESAEKQLYHFIHQITKSIRANPRLTLPDNTDPKSIRAAVIQPLSFENRGEERQIVTITIQYQVGQQITLDIAGVTGVTNVLEESTGSTAGWDTANRKDADGKIDIIPTVYSEKKYYKIEINNAMETELRNLIEAGLPLRTVITTATGYRDVRIFLKNISPTAVYDEIHMAVIEFDILK